MPLPPIGGVQPSEPVTVHFGALEICRPGSWNSAGIKRIAVGADEIVAIFRVGIGRAERRR